MCAIVHRYPDAAVALAEAAGVPLPEHDEVLAAPDAHQMRCQFAANLSVPHAWCR